MACSTFSSSSRNDRMAFPRSMFTHALAGLAQTGAAPAGSGLAPVALTDRLPCEPPFLRGGCLSEHDSSAKVGADFQQQRLVATLTTLFGVLGLVLAAVGLFGVLAYMVERRTGEIGVRMALGADRGRVVGMVLAGAFWQVSVGLGIGIPAAIGAGKLMTVQLFGVQPWDPVMLTIATLLLGVGALVASMIPAWRAACVEPMAALRTE